MEMSFREILIVTLLIGASIFAFISFAYSTQIQNQANSTILSDPSMNASFGSLTRQLVRVPLTTQGQLNATSTEPVTVGFGSIISFAIVGTGRIFTGTITGIYQIFYNLLVQKFGISEIVMQVFLSIILIIIIFSIWRYVRIGS